MLDQDQFLATLSKQIAVFQGGNQFQNALAKALTTFLEDDKKGELMTYVVQVPDSNVFLTGNRDSRYFYYEYDSDVVQIHLRSDGKYSLVYSGMKDMDPMSDSRAKIDIEAVKTARKRASEINKHTVVEDDNYFAPHMAVMYVIFDIIEGFQFFTERIAAEYSGNPYKVKVRLQSADDTVWFEGLVARLINNGAYATASPRDFI